MRLEEKLNTLFPQNSVHFIDDVGILVLHYPRPVLDNRHAAPKAAISVRQFEADVATAKHHQMRGCIVELKRLDIGQRPRGFEARNRGDCRMRADVEEDLVTYQQPRAAVIQPHLGRFRRDKPPAAHNQFGAGGPVVVQMQFDLARHHSRLRWRTFTMSVVTGPVIIVPNSAA